MDESTFHSQSEALVHAAATPAFFFIPPCLERKGEVPFTRNDRFTFAEMQLIGAVQTMYTPITDGIYPEMIKTKSWKFIKRLLMIFMPIVFAGSAFSIAVAPYVLQIVGGEQYVAATSLFRALVPVLIFSFPGIVLGWPTLGALDKAAQVTKTTILSAVVQVASLLLLIATGHFTVMWIAVFRCVTELVLMASRGWYCWKYRKEFY